MSSAHAHRPGRLMVGLLPDSPKQRTVTFGGELLERSWAICEDCGIRLEWARVVGKAAVRSVKRIT